MRARLGVLFASGLLIATVACVGDDPTTPVTTAPAADAGADTGTSTIPTTSDSGSTPTEDSGSNADADAGDSACGAFCDEFEQKCSFQSTSEESYPSSAACRAICARFQPTGASADSLECRRHLLEQPTAECLAAGPWGADQQGNVFCGSDQPCTSLCNVLVPICNDAGADLGNCLDSCDTRLGHSGSDVRSCAERAALSAYTAGSKSDVKTACVSFSTCGAH